MRTTYFAKLDAGSDILVQQDIAPTLFSSHKKFNMDFVQLYASVNGKCWVQIPRAQLVATNIFEIDISFYVTQNHVLCF